jgi:peptidoglycan/xylan/chitin deacetylase (PgdA/CDA1 family)
MKAMAGKAASLFARSGLLGRLEAADRDPSRVRVVAYHRVDEPEAEPDLEPGLISTTPAELRAQAELVARHYNAISLDDLIAAHRGEASLPPRAVLFTVDDGYLDFAEHIWPTLRAAGIPAVLFVPTAFPDVPGPGFWWDRLHAALRRTEERFVDIPGLGRLSLADAGEKRAAHRAIRGHVKTLPHFIAMSWLDDQLAKLADLPSLHRVLGWDALRQLASEGVAVCSHGHSHALCTQLGPAELADDLSTAKRIIERELGVYAPPAVFAYPSSANNADTRVAVREAGYELAFGGGRAIDRLPFEIPHHVTRLPMLRYATDLFRAQLRPSVASLGRLFID